MLDFAKINNMNKNKKTLIALILLGVILFFAFLLLVYRALSSNTIFKGAPASSSRDIPAEMEKYL